MRSPNLRRFGQSNIYLLLIRLPIELCDIPCAMDENDDDSVRFVHDSFVCHGESSGAMERLKNERKRSKIDAKWLILPRHCRDNDIIRWRLTSKLRNSFVYTNYLPFPFRFACVVTHSQKVLTFNENSNCIISFSQIFHDSLVLSACHCMGLARWITFQRNRWSWHNFMCGRQRRISNRVC